MPVNTDAKITFFWCQCTAAGRYRLDCFELLLASLLIFAVTTYSIATVIGFGWLLMIMGVAQCRPQDHVTRFLYVATFLLILIYTAPWAELIMQDL